MIDPVHQSPRAVVPWANADHDPVWIHEIVDRPALFQKLRVGGDLDVVLGIGHEFLNLGVRSNRDSALVDDDEVVGRMLRQLLSNGEDRAQVCLAVVGGRGPDCDEGQINIAHGGREVGRERQASCGRVLSDHLFEARFVDRNLVALKALDLRRVFVDASHPLTGCGKARAGDQANVSGSDYAELHGAWIAPIQRP